MGIWIMIEFESEFTDVVCVEYFLHHFMKKIEEMLVNLNTDHFN